MISCAALAYVWLSKEKKLNDMYYAFPGPHGLIEVAIPNKITKDKDCAKLKDWMQTQTPSDLIMEIPDCPWEREGLIGSFDIEGTNFCMPRSYINIERYEISGAADELRLEFNFDTLEPVDSQIVSSPMYDASNYIDLVIKKNPLKGLCSSNQTCQVAYWNQLISLLERYDSQPLDDVIQLHLEQKSFEGTDLDLYYVDNWRRTCIVDGRTIGEKKGEACEDKSPNLFVLSNEDPTNPSLWLQCVDSRDYMDLRSNGYVCKVRNYYDNNNVVLDVYFDQNKYLTRYKELLQKVEILVNRFQTYYNCQQKIIQDNNVKIIINRSGN